MTQKHETETVKASSVAALPSLPLAPYVTPVEELPRLRQVLGGGPRLLVKRDDAIAFAFGGNKVRKMRLVGADAVARGADTLITTGGVQSNHARVTAATAATLGMKCVLVVNGVPPGPVTANALLDRLLGADIRYVATRRGARAGHGRHRCGPAARRRRVPTSFQSAPPRRSERRRSCTPSTSS